MFDLHNFVLTGVKEMVGNEPDYKVIQLATNYLDKGLLGEDDLEVISNCINDKNQSEVN